MNIEQNTKHAARATQVPKQVEKKAPRSGEAQDAAAPSRHQCRSTCGGQTIGVKYRGFICTFFFHTGGFSKIWARLLWDFMGTTVGLSEFMGTTGGLSDFMVTTGCLSEFMGTTGGLSEFMVITGGLSYFLHYTGGLSDFTLTFRGFIPRYPQISPDIPRYPPISPDKPPVSWKSPDKPPVSWKNWINPRYLTQFFSPLVWTCPDHDGARLLRRICCRAPRCRAPHSQRQLKETGEQTRNVCERVRCYYW